MNVVGSIGALLARVREARMGEVGSHLHSADVTRIARIRARVDAMRSCSDAELLATFRACSSSLESAETVDTRLALVAEATRRAHGLVARDVQLVAALALARGAAVELATGEGKSLVGVLAACVLSGGGVHVVAPNEYLAVRDASFARDSLARLGLSVEAVTERADDSGRRRAYRADVTYGAARAFAFDRLRDGLATQAFGRLGARARAVVVDEIDSVAIDFAAQPFVLGDGGAELDPWPERVRPIVERMREGVDFEVDRRARRAWLTTRGEQAALDRLEELDLVDRALDDDMTVTIVEATRALAFALDARELFVRDRDYSVTTDGEIVPIELTTGRLGVGRRFANGLHSALEAKERLLVRARGRILASLDVRSLFGAYAHVCGMTGTLGGLDEELRDEWDLEVVRLPPHEPCIRIDDVRCFPSEDGALDALVATTVEEHGKGRPVLACAATDLHARRISARLHALGIAHESLTARDHARESAIVARAGSTGAVTVATRIAARGTDIRLGADSDGDAARVRSLGGLRVLGLASASIARIDAQLRGRAGRRGDPGHATIFVSLDDPPFVERATERERGRLVGADTDSSHPRWQDRMRAVLATCHARAALDESATRGGRRKYLGVLEEQHAIVDAMHVALVEGTADPGARAPTDPIARLVPSVGELEAEIGPIVSGRGLLGRNARAEDRVEHDGVAVHAAAIDLYRRYGTRIRANELPLERTAAVAFCAAHVRRSLEHQIDRFVRACAEIRPDALSIGEALAVLSSAPCEEILRAFRVACLRHLAASFQEHCEETRDLVRTAPFERSTRDPARAFRIETHRRFEARLAFVRGAAAAQVVRALRSEYAVEPRASRDLGSRGA